MSRVGVIASLIATALFASTGCGTSGNTVTRIQAAGSTFAYPLYSEMGRRVRQESSGRAD